VTLRPTLKKVSIKLATVFWDMMPRSLIEVSRRFGGKYCPHLKDRKVSQAISKKQRELCLILYYPEDGGSTFLQNLVNVYQST
jgi:hypothetical protein